MNFDARSEMIIKKEGLTFALASFAGNPHDLSLARESLKRAIFYALVEAAKQGKLAK